METKIINEKPYCFTVSQRSNFEKRIDTNWVNPRHKKLTELFEKLPKSKYNIVKLKEIVKVKGGKRIPKGVSHLYTDYDTNAYIRGASDLDNLRINFIECKRISDSIYNKVNGITLIDNDILISIAGTTAKLGFFKISELNLLDLDFNYNKVKFSENLALLRVKDKKATLPEYILYYLNSYFGQFQLSRFTVGSNQGKISLDSLRNMYIPIPNDLSEQEALVDEIKHYYQQVREEHREKYRLINYFDVILNRKFNIKIPELKKIFSSESSIKGDRIDAMSMNPSLKTLINNIKSIPYFKIGKVAIVKKANDYKIPVMNYYGMINIENIDESIGEVRIVEDVNIVDIPADQLLVKEGNIYVSRINPDLGNVFYGTNKLSGSITSPEMRSIEVTSEDILPKYLWIMCRSQFAKRQWKCQISESSRRRINKDVINNTYIPWISKEEQNNLIKQCEELNNKIKEKRRIINELGEKARGILTTNIFNIESIDNL